MSPICAVSQKRQPIAQPIWLDTHRVVVVPLARGIGIRTLSVSSPSMPASVSRSTNLLVAPSTSVAVTG